MSDIVYVVGKGFTYSHHDTRVRFVFNPCPYITMLPVLERFKRGSTTLTIEVPRVIGLAIVIPKTDIVFGLDVKGRSVIGHADWQLVKGHINRARISRHFFWRLWACGAERRLCRGNLNPNMPKAQNCGYKYLNYAAKPVANPSHACPVHSEVS
jgi:hypothetical protein